MEDIVHVLKSQEDTQLVSLIQRPFFTILLIDVKLCLVVYRQGNCLKVDRYVVSMSIAHISSFYQLHWVLDNLLNHYSSSVTLCPDFCTDQGAYTWNLQNSVEKQTL